MIDSINNVENPVLISNWIPSTDKNGAFRMVRVVHGASVQDESAVVAAVTEENNAFIVSSRFQGKPIKEFKKIDLDALYDYTHIEKDLPEFPYNLGKQCCPLDFQKFIEQESNTYPIKLAWCDDQLLKAGYILPEYFQHTKGILLSGWIEEDHCAFRMLAGNSDYKRDNVEYRIAFIEKTPRIRTKNLSSVDKNSKDYLNWFSGLKSSEYGKSTESRIWCDSQLLARGYILG